MTNSLQNNPALEAPSISAVPEGVQRPLWSVMIPTFNCAKYLRQTLESVLDQDPGPEEMQIEVVDDCSTKDDPAPVVWQVGRGRATFFRKERNQGAIANFNTCIERSRGHLVHILHGDDYLLPGFYARVEAAAKSHPHVGLFFTRSLIVTEDGKLAQLSPRAEELEMPQRNPGWLFYDNAIRTPSVVVRRTCYEQSGGFLRSLVHVADWEMWVRSITRYGGLCLNSPLSAYRCFPGNDTGQLARTAENLHDYMRLGDIWSRSYPEFDAVKFRRIVAAIAARQRENFMQRNDELAVAANERLWKKLTPWPERVLKIVGASLRDMVSRLPNS